MFRFLHVYKVNSSQPICFTIVPSIHPSSTALSGIRSGIRSRGHQSAQNSRSTYTSSKLSGGTQKRTEATERHSPLRLLPMKHDWNTSPGRRPEQRPKPPKLVNLDVEEQWLYSELLSGESAPHPAKETHFDFFYVWCCPFGNYLVLMTIGEECWSSGTIVFWLEFPQLE